MAEGAKKEFGTRKPVAIQPAAPVKRSSHVALLLAGTVAIGSGAYALMPGENCAPSQPGMAAPGPGQAGCSPRGSSGGSSRYSFYSGNSGSNKSGAASSESGSGGVTRGGFGSFAHAIGAHFSGGG